MRIVCIITSRALKAAQRDYVMNPISLLLLAAIASPEGLDDSDPDSQRADVVVTGARGEASEGTDSYTTGTNRTATRLPLSYRETPQSVSVVTLTQIDDFAQAKTHAERALELDPNIVK